MIEKAVYIALGFAIFAAGMWAGIETEKKNQRHRRNRAKTLHPCRTYTTTASNVNVTWGHNA